MIYNVFTNLLYFNVLSHIYVTWCFIWVNLGLVAKALDIHFLWSLTIIVILLVRGYVTHQIMTGLGFPASRPVRNKCLLLENCY